jgi:ABC-type uncharacterized transport system permease subunit
MHNIQICSLHLLAAWIGFLCGVLSGAMVGLFFHREDWLGGYGSYPRRLVRLGHISFFGLGFLNALFALTVSTVQMPELTNHLASIGLLVGAITMPLCCFVAAWRKSLRTLFAIPVASLLGSVALVVLMLAR